MGVAKGDRQGKRHADARISTAPIALAEHMDKAAAVTSVSGSLPVERPRMRLSMASVMRSRSMSAF